MCREARLPRLTIGAILPTTTSRSIPTTLTGRHTHPTMLTRPIGTRLGLRLTATRTPTILPEELMLLLCLLILLTRFRTIVTRSSAITRSVSASLGRGRGRLILDLAVLERDFTLLLLPFRQRAITATLATLVITETRVRCATCATRATLATMVVRVLIPLGFSISESVLRTTDR